MKLQTLKNIIKNNGATLNKNGESVEFKKGYQVSKKDCYTLNINNTNEVLDAINNILNTIKQNEFCGIWIEEGKAYIDISIKIDSLSKALKLGKELKQISIFDWNTKKCIYCNN
nr:MAG TPA: hypothetical protein [Caudoviricetes sp.]